MTEIDFLPNWYKFDKKKQKLLRIQCIALGCMFLLFMTWSFVSNHSFSKFVVTLVRDNSKTVEANKICKRYAGITKEISQLDKKAVVLEDVDSKINIPSVLAELSFLISKKVVLSEVQLTSEQLGLKKTKKKRKGNNSHAGSVRFKVTLTGTAVDSKGVADLVCKLEESLYFYSIIPSFSRNKAINVTSNLVKNKGHINEFKIGCYLANYRPREELVAKSQ
ncbi:MAG: PilN domain-containing protein [Planctomycetota bacterium]|jgi:hypothetical protein